MDPGQTPVTTATAKLLIVPDTTEFEDAKRKIEESIQELSDKFKAAFEVRIEGFADKIDEQVQRLESAGKQITESSPEQARAAAGVPDQVLVKLTEIQEDLSRLVRANEELVEALTTRQA